MLETHFRCEPGLIPKPDTITGCGPECVRDPDCKTGFICQNQKCIEKPDPCNPSPCGPGAVCMVNNVGNPICRLACFSMMKDFVCRIWTCLKTRPWFLEGNVLALLSTKSLEKGFRKYTNLLTENIYSYHTFSRLSKTFLIFKPQIFVGNLKQLIQFTDRFRFKSWQAKNSAYSHGEFILPKIRPFASTALAWFPSFHSFEQWMIPGIWRYKLSFARVFIICPE